MNEKREMIESNPFWDTLKDELYEVIMAGLPPTIVFDTHDEALKRWLELPEAFIGGEYVKDGHFVWAGIEFYLGKLPKYMGGIP